MTPTVHFPTLLRPAARLLAAALLVLSPVRAAGQTLEACLQAAEQNYPLIRQYDLVSRTAQLTVANIQKGWLPQISAQAQATLQSDVTAWPDEMQAMLGQMGVDVKGLRKDQYRVGIDVQQTVYDGGLLRSQQEVARRQASVQAAQTDINIYNVRKRVCEMYFALLLTDEQLGVQADLVKLLAANEQKLGAMQQRGTAAQSDYQTVRAERLATEQQTQSLTAQRQTLKRLLGVFCGLTIDSVVRPPMPAAQPVGTEAMEQRPEMRAVSAQLRLADAQEHALDAALRPRLSLFAQGYYGYPGLNMFQDMLRHDWSLNGLVGARLSWNIGALYTRKNDKARIQLQRESALNSRDVFVFNNRMEQQQQSDDLQRYRDLMAADDEIIALRTAVRKAAESKLAHGIIDVNDLLKELHAESTAKAQQQLHKIEMLKEAYSLRITNGEK